jgi:hypothetical protein
MTYKNTPSGQVTPFKAKEGLVTWVSLGGGGGGGAGEGTCRVDAKGFPSKEKIIV